MTPEEHNSLLPANVKGKACQNLLEGAAAKDLAIEHIFERASVARALHAAEMLLRRGIGRMSVEEARVFTKTDPRFVPLDPDGALAQLPHFQNFFGAFWGGNRPQSRYFTRSISQKCQL